MASDAPHPIIFARALVRGLLSFADASWQERRWGPDGDWGLLWESIEEFHGASGLGDAIVSSMPPVTWKLDLERPREWAPLAFIPPLKPGPDAMESLVTFDEALERLREDGCDVSGQSEAWTRVRRAAANSLHAFGIAPPHRYGRYLWRME